jgi:hypothetical protein
MIMGHDIVNRKLPGTTLVGEIVKRRWQWLSKLIRYVKRAI